LSGGATDTYTAVLTSAGIVRLIDSAGTGSGTLQPSGTDFNKMHRHSHSDSRVWTRTTTGRVCGPAAHVPNQRNQR